MRKLHFRTARDPAPGRATFPPAPGSRSTRNRGGGLPPPGPLSFLHSRGLAAPVRRATRVPSVPPAPLLGDSLSQDSPSREGNRLEMRAPAKEIRKIQSVFSRSQFRIRDQGGSGNRLSATPTPQSAGAWDHRVEDTSPGAHCSSRPGRPSLCPGRPVGNSLVSRGEPRS